MIVAGKYELGRVLGTGAMGAVYEGVHVELGKRVAVKVIHPGLSDSREVEVRFRREARAASAAESAHIAQIFDFGRDDALGLYMVIEYLEGEDLEARLARERRIDAADSARIGWQVARGLSRAHAAGVIHRDLKPGNVFLTRRDDGALLAKILDFGISKLGAYAPPAAHIDDAGSPDDPPLTERGKTLGTPQYMSPEQCIGREELDGRTDVWSLCAVLYEMLAGEPAFAATGGFVEVMERIVSRDAAPLGERAPWVPPVLARIVDAGLARDRDARLGDAGELADRLLDALGSVDERARVDTAPPSSGEDPVEVFMRRGPVPVQVAARRKSGS